MESSGKVRWNPVTVDEALAPFVALSKAVPGNKRTVYTNRGGAKFRGEVWIDTYTAIKANGVNRVFVCYVEKRGDEPTFVLFDENAMRSPQSWREFVARADRVFGPDRLGEALDAWREVAVRAGAGEITASNGGRTAPRPHQTWLFQANPTYFDIDSYLVPKPESFLWLARQRAGEMEVGDRVFVWRAIGGGDRALSGVIAEAEIAEPPAVQPEDLAAVRFWKRRGGGDPAVPQRRVRLRLLRVAEEDKIIRRDAALDDPVLSRMPILTARTGTNFLLDGEQADRLHALWTGAGAGSGPLEPTEADTRPFDPRDVQDARETVARQIKARRGQKEFRDKLLAAYGRRCAITGCRVLHAVVLAQEPRPGQRPAVRADAAQDHVAAVELLAERFQACPRLRLEPAVSEFLDAVGEAALQVGPVEGRRFLAEQLAPLRLQLRRGQGLQRRQPAEHIGGRDSRNGRRQRGLRQSGGSSGHAVLRVGSA